MHSSYCSIFSFCHRLQKYQALFKHTRGFIYCWLQYDSTFKKHLQIDQHKKEESEIPRRSSSSNFFRYWSSCCMCVSTYNKIMKHNYKIQNQAINCLHV
jgi:hypothetical protein